jgi:hypothetical protein
MSTAALFTKAKFWNHPRGPITKDKENVVYIHEGVLFSPREQQNYVICRKIDRTVDH